MKANTFENIDCMEMLKKCPPKHFDLAIVDPPYGIDIADWDTKEHKPTPEYFEQLFRVSKNQIIWGGNYFNLPINRGWIFWYKAQNDLNMGDGELAWTSFDSVIRQVKIHRVELWKEQPIHVTQKPVKLYRWLLNRYAAAGDLILDTHVGSGSSIIACIEGGFNYYGCEIDKEYYEAAKKRIGRAFRKYELEFADEAV